ncbi:hypothetical protein BV898_09948 [Hypsibius exemplaris]|uniref:Uncharacterized protein n=1 Tax=Hypsibius exemplaris TaxID=2072580 RepID=A0A1W0WKV4_HYPEX|nr:hypothetical protein BV898_09948 [Hypsibius exemplaris]
MPSGSKPRRNMFASGRAYVSCLRHKKGLPPKEAITAKQWLQSLVVDRSAGSDGQSSSQQAHTDDLAQLARQVVVHQSTMTCQNEIPKDHHFLSLQLTQEPRAGVSLSPLDRLRLFILKRKIFSSRKHSDVEEIALHPHGIPQFEKLYAATNQHVSFNRRKLFDPVLPVASRRLAADSIITDFDILCPLKPRPHLQQMKRQRDRTRVCLVRTIDLGISFEASDFMVRWFYRRCLQTAELDGIQLTRIQEEADLEEDYNLSLLGHYHNSKCLASKLVAARRSAALADSLLSVSSDSTVSPASMRYSVMQLSSLMAIAADERDSLHCHITTCADGIPFRCTITMALDEIVKHHGVDSPAAETLSTDGSGLLHVEADFSGDAPVAS